jgi:outer membrane biogenesis lipoprotein LolB
MLLTACDSRVNKNIKEEDDDEEEEQQQQQQQEDEDMQNRVKYNTWLQSGES